MNHNTAKELSVETTSPKRSRQQGLFMDVKAANHRLLELLDTMMRERWLPIGLRTMMVQDLPEIRKQVALARPKEDVILASLESFVAAAEEYGEKVSRSETIGLVRSLVYEFSCARSISNVAA